MNTTRRALAGLFVLAALSGCSGGGGGGGGFATNTGSLTLGVTDAPVDDATKVVVEFTGVELQPQSGKAITINLPAPRQIDLLALSGTASELILDKESLPAGHYNWIRLLINAPTGTTDSYIELSDGTTHTLSIPSGAETGLKLVRGFDVLAGGSPSFTIDFNLRKSVHNPSVAGGDYELRPALKLVDDSEVGTLSGTVSMSLATDSSCSTSSAVYIFEGANVTPDDIDGIDPDPVATATVKQDPKDGIYKYTAGFLEAGDYTVAFTCQANLDNPDTNDTIAFVGTANVTITAGATTTHDF